VRQLLGVLGGVLLWGAEGSPRKPGGSKAPSPTVSRLPILLRSIRTDSNEHCWVLGSQLL
jgi:hypothetical protein